MRFRYKFSPILVQILKNAMILAVQALENYNLTEQRYKPYEYLYVNIHKAFSLISLSTS